MAHGDDGELSAVQQEGVSCKANRMSRDSISTVSTTSLVFERIDDRLAREQASGHRSRGSDGAAPYTDRECSPGAEDEALLKDELAADDPETGAFLANGATASHPDVRGSGSRQMDRSLRRVLMVVAALLTAAWLAGLAVYVSSKAHQHPSAAGAEHDPQATPGQATGKKLTLGQLYEGTWRPKTHAISWIAGAGGEDGLLLERGTAGKDYLVVEDVRAQGGAGGASGAQSSRTLMKSGTFEYDGRSYKPDAAAPSKDLKRVLLTTDVEKNWRHSSTGVYWIFDVEAQGAEPLVPGEPDARLQLAQWSPTSDSVVYTRDNNMYLRRLGERHSKAVTDDGGAEVFNGVPDWVYEEEVLAGAKATWWSQDGQYFAFLRTNETGVPEYPVQYFVSRPSGREPEPGEEPYPEVRMIKYPKAGAHNPVVDLKFYDVRRGDVFAVDVAGRFADDDRLITSILWAGGKVILKETNRVSDVMHVVVIDVAARAGRTVRTVDVDSIDGGWFEISQSAHYVPADTARGRALDGYIDTVIHEGRDHLAYFSPVENPEPVMLTSGEWEVVDAPSAVDLERNLVYFVSTKESSIQRHVYSVGLGGEGLAPLTNITAEGYYGVSFSSGAGYALVSYHGPRIPWQKVISTPSNPDRYEHVIEDNAELSDSARRHDLPAMVYGTVSVDGIDLNYVERRPPHFDKRRQYPVLFYQYSGPGSQSVSKQFAVDFQSYVAASLGYLVVTVDGRGTGFIGRGARVAVRGSLGVWESHDQIAAARHWASLDYVDASRLAIWGWSFGGFTTLKTLEQDAGRTFSYGMAVAPVTDWRYYDSIYTERYMRTPQANAAGYDASAVANASALAQSVRFLLMHGVADDNVHMQNSLVLLDKLDLEGVENYDVHVFPDSDHSIRFHNANRIVYDKLSNWLVNAFNGEWLKVDGAKPNGSKR